MERGSLVHLPSALLGPRANPDARWVMGVDGGATKTEAAVLDLHERAVYRASGGPSNEDAIGARAAVAALLEVADRAIAKASVAHHQLARTVVAVAGTDTEDITRHMRAERIEPLDPLFDQRALLAVCNREYHRVHFLCNDGRFNAS